MVIMGKKAGMLFVLLFLLVTGQAEAHTVLKESTPAEGQTMDVHGRRIPAILVGPSIWTYSHRLKIFPRCKMIL